MDTGLEPQDLTFDAFTLCSFVPTLPNGQQHARAIPLVFIGYRHAQEPSFVWLVPKEGIDPSGLTNDPYYAKVLREPHSYFRKKIKKYVEKTGSVKRGIEMLIECHQEHLAFSEFKELDKGTLARPIEVELVTA